MAAWPRGGGQALDGDEGVEEGWPKGEKEFWDQAKGGGFLT